MQKKYLREEIERYTTSINQKMKTIEKIQQIQQIQQEFAECIFVMDNLESEIE